LGQWFGTRETVKRLIKTRGRWFWCFGGGLKAFWAVGD
jgi:hypothetical protein